jgi:hypothetical protein
MRGLLLVVALLFAAVGCGPPPTPPAATDDHVLERWATWAMSGLPQPGQTESPRRNRCEQDPASALWFVDTPSPNDSANRWTCTVPARSALLVVPVYVGIDADGLDCATVLAQFTGSAELDGATVMLQRAGPIRTRGLSSGPTFGDCLQWGVTPELDPGSHALTMTVTGPGFGTVEVTVDLAAT